VAPQGEKLILTGIGISKHNQQMKHLGLISKLDEQTPLGTEWQLSVHHRGLMEKIQQAIGTNTALAVLDGSFQDHCGACTWIIEGEQSEDQIKGSMHTPGLQQDHSSFQSEAAGIYGALVLTVWYFLQEYPTTGTITIACDGRLVLDQLRSKKSIDPFTAHSDLLWACKAIQHQMVCNIKFVHVKGHQDKGYPTVLSREAWLNIKADLAAKIHISNDTPKYPNLPLPFKPWRLVINNVKVVKHHQQAIRLAMNGPVAHQYWEEKILEVPHLHMEMDLKAMERAFSESMLGRHRWVTKHITGHFAHGKNMPEIDGGMPLMPS